MNSRCFALMMGVLALGSAVHRSASACGGFFCSQTQPVNQAAERIVFAHNGDGTVTAVIEIQYEGPSESFSWLLPIASVPMGDELAVASNAAFQRLQAATNPLYQLTTVIEGTCGFDRSDSTSANGSSAPPALPGSAEDGDAGVNVVASGAVGPFEWTAISLDAGLEDPAAAAVTWLEANGYDVPDGAPALLGPYLEDGMYLLALRLQKGRDTGSIRPIVLTYEAERPMIPIKLTAVAANDDMGVMTWVLGEGQAVPQNYNALELNEARINWFNPNLNYNDVVIAAADEASGQGFVTEYAQPTTGLSELVWASFEESQWQSLRTSAFSASDLYFQAAAQYSAFDGFWDAVQANGVLPTGITLEELQACPTCYTVTITDSTAFLDALETQVIEPVRLVQRLIDEHPKITRLYTTLSAAEMTVDPLFTFNPELADVSNIHNAERIIECGDGIPQDEAQWRIELPGGGVIRGRASDVGTWPTAFDTQPANQRILRQGETGEGQVLEDNTATISQALSEHNAAIEGEESGCGCSVPGGGNARDFWVGLLGVSWLVARRRRRRG